MCPEHQAALLSVIACGQPHVVTILGDGDWRSKMTALAEDLTKVMQFYDSIGGIVGYQLKCLELIYNARKDEAAARDGESAGPPGGGDVSLLVPQGPDLKGPGGRSVANCAAGDGLRALPNLAEIYPLGGAGDRLGLQCEDTGEPLPAAMLPYCGRPMLEGLIRDLQAREYLHFNIFGVQHTTPVAIMTSDAKGNHARVAEMLRASAHFGRPQASFRLFCQPLVPVIEASTGLWVLPEALRPSFKPGGHGAIWKLMWDKGVFDWLRNNGREAALIRQISNPMASTDSTLLALAGIGFRDSRAFGFASCERTVGAAEGMNVLMQQRVPPLDGGPGPSEYLYGITNVEYTEFERLGIRDQAASDGSNLSCFPANTNILYVGLRQAEAAVRAGIEKGGDASLPGMIFNLSKRITYTSALGGPERRVAAGRMECTMQNLADSLLQRFPTQMLPEQASALSTFVVFNERRYVTSSAKRKRAPGSTKLHQTPDGSFLDLMRNARDLLSACGVDVPDPGSTESYLARGPSFIFLFNPALGPLWQVIEQKIRGGRVSDGAEVVLEAAEVLWRGVVVEGSLLVECTNVVGHFEAAAAPTHGGQHNGSGVDRGTVRFSERNGRVRLENVTVRNAGVDFSHPGNRFWSHTVHRREACRITLHGRAEFEARDVTLSHDVAFDVPDGHRMVVTPSASAAGYESALLPLSSEEPTWRWRYSLQEDGVVELSVVDVGGADSRSEDSDSSQSTVSVNIAAETAM